ncbi:hypothetical protein MKX01_002634 [Papaver californicum]|nr:hypothetical protein MKX01_002634 [Papaver californicum]
MASSSFPSMVVVILSLLLVFFSGSSRAQLSTTYYSKTCPNVLTKVKSAVQSAISKEMRAGAALLRLHFHDCFVNGCDGSGLLDDTSSFTGEKNAVPNKNSARGFDVVDNIKTAVEKACPGVVHVLISWKLQLETPLGILISCFSNVGLSTKDMIFLSGAHIVGKARCANFRARIYNETNIDNSFATTSKRNFPSASSGDNKLAPLDKGLLHSDQVLFNGGSTDSQVRTYSNNPSIFSVDFAVAMIKMGGISPLTGSNGEIRKNCRKAN